MSHPASRPLTYLALSLFLALTACSESTGGTPPGSGAPPPVGGVEPYVMKGTVTDRLGNPLPGVEVFADNTLAYDSNLLGVTDAGGGYRIDLGGVPTTWRGGAYIDAEFEGQVYNLRLEADDENVFAGADGAVRNFTWKLSGRTPGGDGFYGGTVYLYGDYAVSDFDMANVELTFVPEGPLIDGHPGETLVLRPDPGYIYDVPIGRYTVTGHYLDPSGTVRPVLLAPKSGAYASTQSAAFVNDPFYGTILEFNVQVQ